MCTCRYKRFAALYLLSGLSGSTASYLLTDLTTVGASGACFGLVGALVAYFARNPRLERAGFQLLFLIGIVSFNFLLGADEGGMIDNTGHVAGFLSGLWLGWGLSPQWQLQVCLSHAQPECRGMLLCAGLETLYACQTGQHAEQQGFVENQSGAGAHV